MKYYKKQTKERGKKWLKKIKTKHWLETIFKINLPLIQLEKHEKKKENSRSNAVIVFENKASSHLNTIWLDMGEILPRFLFYSLCITQACFSYFYFGLYFWLFLFSFLFIIIIFQTMPLIFFNLYLFALYNMMVLLFFHFNFHILHFMFVCFYWSNDTGCLYHFYSRLFILFLLSLRCLGFYKTYALEIPSH